MFLCKRVESVLDSQESSSGREPRTFLTSCVSSQSMTSKSRASTTAAPLKSSIMSASCETGSDTVVSGEKGLLRAPMPPPNDERAESRCRPTVGGESGGGGERAAAPNGSCPKSKSSSRLNDSASRDELAGWWAGCVPGTGDEAVSRLAAELCDVLLARPNQLLACGSVACEPSGACGVG